MSNQSDVQAFLESHRARITPAQAGLPDFGGTRRVPGLRRTEVALLAGVSVEYYTRLERGNLSGVSEGVLESLSRALNLDEAERSYLFDLARTASASGLRTRRRPTAQLRPSVQRILDSMSSAPAFVRNGRLDVIAANHLGRALYSPLYNSPLLSTPGHLPNHARFNFLDPQAKEFWDDWDKAAYDTVAILRHEAGRDPYNRALTDLIGELSTRSETFRTLWAGQNVRLHTNGVKSFHHPAIGAIELTYEVMDLPGDPGLKLLAYSAEPNSASHDALTLLASWAAPALPTDVPVPAPADEI